MRDALKAWMELGDKVAGWKAAVYGAVGVVLGAAGGLAADYVTTGDMSSEQIGRGVMVLVAILALVAIIVTVVERFRLVERLIKRLGRQTGR